MGQLFRTQFGIPYFQRIFVDVYGRKDVFAYHFLRDYDSILKVVTLPRHKGHGQVSAQGQFALLGRVSLTKYLTLLDLVAFSDDRL